MAKAQITLPDGTNVKLTGTPAEVAEVLQRVGARAQAGGTVRRPAAATRGPRTTAAAKSSRPLTDLIESILADGFFKKPKDLAAVKGVLAEMGHHYPVTTLSPALLRLVRRRKLRRIKQAGRWMYTG